MEIPNCISRCLEETNFFNDQKKLDTMYYLMQGLPYKEITRKVEKDITYVQKVMNFLKRNKLLHWGRWSPNVYKIGMRKSIAFLDLRDKELPVNKENGNYIYATYVHHVKAEKTKILVIYTYPKGDEPEIKGDRGEQITPFYYTHTRFTVPFFKKINLFKEFFDEFDSMKNDVKILTGTPSFEEKPYTDPITVYICRYGELLPELTPRILTEQLEQDFRDYNEINVSYSKVRDTLSKMKNEEVIFPQNALYLKPLSYQAALIKIKTKKIYEIMGTFNQFNMLTRLAKTREQDIFYLYLQYPFYQLPEVMEIFDELVGEDDQDCKAYIETKFVMGDTIYYKWSLERFLQPEIR
jgi:hypothetical protein